MEQKTTIHQKKSCCLLAKGQQAAFRPTQHGVAEQIKSYLQEHFREKITLDTLVQQFKYEKFYLLRQFKLHTNLTPIHYLILLRLEEAKSLMHSSLSLAQIALESGFYDQSHFSNSFQKFVGLSPMAYRKKVFTSLS
jgi:AraC-like DNA-binding protein